MVKDVSGAKAAQQSVRPEADSELLMAAPVAHIGPGQPGR